MKPYILSCQHKILLNKTHFHFQFQVYMNAKPAPKLSELLFLTVIGHLAKVTYTTEVIFYWLLRGSCHIRSVEIGVEY